MKPRGSTQPSTQRPRNVLLFIADGLRQASVTPESCPAMSQLRDSGVYFRNSYSVFPTFTGCNASAMATGHYLGDSGGFGDWIYSGFRVASFASSVVVALDQNPVLVELDRHFGGNFLNEETVLKAARDRGFSTAAIGKLGTALMFDHTEDGRGHTIVVDDSTGRPGGIALPPDVVEAFAAAGLSGVAPPPVDNIGDFCTPGTKMPNDEQQQYFVDVMTKVLLPIFAKRNKPFVLVYWSRDPGLTQHIQGDSLNSVVPGVNGPTSHAAVRSTDHALSRLRSAIVDLGLAESTNIIVASDHGFVTISKESRTSVAAQAEYSDVPRGLLPPGFLAIDLAKALALPLFDPNKGNALVPDNAHTRGWCPRARSACPGLGGRSRWRVRSHLFAAQRP